MTQPSGIAGFNERFSNEAGGARKQLPVVLRVRAVESLFISWHRPGMNAPYVLSLSQAARTTSGHPAVASHDGIQRLPHADPAPVVGPDAAGETGVDRVRLIDRVTGLVWRQGVRWSAQFQSQRLVVDPASWTAGVLNLIIRLTRHSKQARSAYPVLRRLSLAQMQQLLKAAQSYNPRWEQLVWGHLQRVRRKDATACRIQRVVFKDFRCPEGSLKSWMLWFVTLLQNSGLAAPGIIKFKAFRGKTVKKVLSTKGLGNALC